jgi:hypothetical protein
MIQNRLETNLRGLGLLFLFLPAGGQVLGNSAEFHAQFIEDAPLIDGRLDDICWQQAAVTGGFHNASGGDPGDPVPPTQIQIACDDENLFVAVKAEAVSTGVAETIEIAFDTRYHRTYRATFRLQVTDDGSWVTHAADPFQLGDLPLEVAAREERDWLVMEAAIPFAVIHPMEVGDKGWGFNVIRERRALKDEEASPKASAWSVVGSQPRHPKEFGRLYVPADLRPYHCTVEEDGEGRPGDDKAGSHFSSGLTVRIVDHNGYPYVQVGNDTGRHQLLVAEATGDLPMAPARFELSLSPGERRLLPPRLPATFTLGLTVSDAGTGRIRFQGATRQEETVDPAEPAMDVTAADRDRGYVVFTRDPLERGTRRSVPRRDERDQPLVLLATPGEYEPTSFAVHALEDLENVRIDVSDFAGPGGAILPSAAAGIQLVESMTWWKTPVQYRRIEAFLIGNRPRDIATGFTQRYWLTVKVPESAVPGRYQGEVRITPASDEASTMAVHLDVLPFSLSPPTGMNYFLYFPSVWLPARIQTAQYYRRIFATMRDYGMTTCTLYAYPGDEGTDLNHDNQGALPLAGQLELMRETGLLGEGAAVPWVGAEVYGLPSWKTVYGEAQRRGWPELLMYIVDEPGPNSFKTVRDNMARIDAFRAAHPEVPVRTTTAGADHPEICEYYDVWIANTHHVMSEVTARAREMGKTVWSYDCNLGPVDTLTTRHYFGLWCWKNGVQGASFWAAVHLNATDGRLSGGCSWRGTEQDLVEYEHRYNFIYPGRDEVFASIGLAGAREGVDDYRYLLTLARTLETARDAGASHEAVAGAEDWLERLRDSLDGDAMGRVALDTWKTSGMKAVWYDRPAPDPGLSIRDYHRIRRELADHIIALRQAMPKD